MLLRSTLLCLTALCSLNAIADESVRYNQVSLRTEVSQEVTHDLMQVTLYSEAQHQDAAQLAKQTTQTLNQAINQARAVKTVTIHQGSRHSYAVYDEKGGKIIAWRERAEIRLESHDFAALAKLSAELLGELRMGQMDFSVSKKKRAEHEEALLSEAIGAFNARAQKVSQALGGQDFKLVSMSLDSPGFYAVPRMQSAAPAMAKMMDSPEIEAGTSQVQINISGVIEVQKP